MYFVYHAGIDPVQAEKVTTTNNKNVALRTCQKSL